MTEAIDETLLESVFALRPDIRFRRVGDEAVVLAQDQGEVLVLNEVGARALELLDGETPAVEWLPTLLREYTVEEATLRADLARYLAELRTSGVITPR
jgi:hypothetical protein